MSFPSGYTVFCVHQAIKKLYKDQNYIWDKKPLKIMSEEAYSKTRFKNPYDWFRYKLETYNNACAYIFSTMAHGFNNAIYDIKPEFIQLTSEFLKYQEGFYYYFERQISLINNIEFKNGECQLFNLFLDSKVNIYTLSILNQFLPFLDNWLQTKKFDNQKKFIMSIKQNYQTLNYENENINNLLNKYKLI